MKAIVLKAIKAPLVVEERAELAPGPDEVVVRLKAAALNRRDYWITQGLYPGIEPPVVLGSDGAGVVVKLGANLGNFWQDKEVIINPGLNWGKHQQVQADEFTILGLPQDGTLAEEVVVPVSQLHAKPQHLSWHEAAALPLAGLTAYRALFSQGGMKAGERVLITGIGGGVATFALQYAVAAGASVWVTSSSSEKIERAVKMGAKGGFDYREEGWWKALSQSGNSPDVIIDSAGGKGYGDLLAVAAPGARIVNYGATAGPPEKLDLFKVFWKQLRLIGSTMGSPSDFAAMLEYVEKHQLRTVVDRVFSLEEANDAIELMGTSPQFGKYVIESS